MRNILRKTAYLFTISFLMISCTGIYENGQEMAESVKCQTKNIDVKELRKKIDKGEDFLLIDIRQKSEADIATIPGAVIIPRGILETIIRNDEFWEEEFLYTPENDDEIVLYCQLGHRSALAALALQQLGFTKVRFLEGGIISWDPDIEKNAPKASGGGCGG